ncbi:MAG: ribonuclease III [Deltaproteobacteria bacterium CG11_big_fil_rev_8_21_14_0_20_47_16]|nr:MAG: ribonuclease III [Deltaproteobacteria bacterium CG11_big_fil_rev_8_21_14_0_20_47_16]
MFAKDEGLTKEDKTQLKELEKKLSFKFSDRLHLKRALTHRSYANENRLAPTDHNERYEFLGDAVLELSISHLLMKHFSDHSEGELSKLRASIVNETQLAEIARGLDLGQFLYLGKGEDQTGGRDKPSLLADAFEAILGAMYLDRGWEKAFAMVTRYYKPVLEAVSAGDYIKDFKTQLQEEAQSRFHAIPKYRLVKETGPDHQKVFEINLYIGEELYGVGTGMSKKAAEQEAAKEALTKLKN